MAISEMISKINNFNNQVNQINSMINDEFKTLDHSNTIPNSLEQCQEEQERPDKWVECLRVWVVSNNPIRPKTSSNMGKTLRTNNHSRTINLNLLEFNSRNHLQIMRSICKIEDPETQVYNREKLLAIKLLDKLVMTI